MMYSREEIITPEIAENYLRSNHSNRKLKQRAIANYARDMRCGKWELNPEGISFYEDGTLANGQNRLNAVIKAGVPVTFYVHRNVPKSAFIFDRGVSRSTVDVMNMKGNAPSVANPLAVAIANFLFSLCGKYSVSENTKIDFLTENADLIQRAISVARTTGTKNNKTCRQTPVVSAIFCALYCGVDDDALREFCYAANTGFSTSEYQTPAIVLRRYMEETCSWGNWISKKTAFVEANCAIKDFANKKPRRKAYPVDSACVYFDVVKAELLAPYIESYDGIA